MFVNMPFDYFFNHRTQYFRRNSVNFNRFAFKVFASRIGFFSRARLQIQSFYLLRRNADNLKIYIGVRREGSQLCFNVSRNIAPAF